MLTTKVLSIPHKPSLVALGIALGTNLLNQFIVEPLSTDNMLRRYRMEEKGFTDSAAYKVRNSYLIVETTPCVSTNISVRHRDVCESFSRWIDRTIVNRSSHQQRGRSFAQKLKASFGKFHGLSSLLNLITLCAGTTHGYYLSAALLQ